MFMLFWLLAWTEQLVKITFDKATGVIITPFPGTQCWLPVMIELPINFLIELPRTLKMLTLISCKDALHSLHQRLKLLAVYLSGKQSNIATFHAKLQTLLRNCEECWIQNMTQFSVNHKSIWHQWLKIFNVHM